MDLAGHRTTEPHDCFLMNCKDLGPENDMLRTRVVEMAAEIDRLQALIDGEDAGIYDRAAFVASVTDGIRAKGGEVGTLTGTPIIGTNDTVNSGPARRVSGEVVVDGAVAAPNVSRGKWRPAGEVGTILDKGVSLVEEPKNDAQPVQVGPSDPT